MWRIAIRIRCLIDMRRLIGEVVFWKAMLGW